MELREPAKNRRSIFSVSFTPEELAAVAQKARSEGKSTGRYIADCALMGVKLPTVHLLVDGETISVSRTG